MVFAAVIQGWGMRWWGGSKPPDKGENSPNVVMKVHTPGSAGAGVVSEQTVAAHVQVVEHAGPWKHVLVWFIGVIVASLMPFLWLYLSNKPNNSPPSVWQMLGEGELYIIAIVVLIAGVTEIILLLRQIRQATTVALLILGAILFVIVDAAKYAGASELSPTAPPLHSVTFWSIGAFVISALHSSICVGLAAGAR